MWIRFEAIIVFGAGFVVRTKEWAVPFDALPSVAPKNLFITVISDLDPWHILTANAEI